MRELRCREAFLLVGALLLLAASAVAQPTNDDCSNATTPCNSIAQNGSTINATEECGGADSDCLSAGAWAGCYDVSGSIWYRFETVPAGGQVTVTIDVLSCVDTSDALNAVLIATTDPCNPGTYSSVDCTTAANNTFTLGGALNGNTVYYVQVANALDTVPGSGCNFTISASGPGLTPSFSETLTPPTCPGGCDGIAQSGTSFGTPPFMYVWSTGTQGQTTGNLCAGDYMVTVTDSAGCTAVDTVTIVDPPQFDLQFFSQPSGCDTTDGAISAVATGTVPFTYAWSTGANTAAISGVGPGAYGITVVDANGCQLDTVGVVNSTGGPSLTTTTTNVTCNGGNDGTATVTATGGNPPYTYTWNDPGNQTTVQAINLAAGSYVVTVEDGGSCEAFIAVTINEPPPLMGSTTTTPETCTGMDGTATVAVTGGTGAYTYNWSAGGQMSTTITGLATGNYNVTVTDENGCTQDFMAVVGQQTDVNNLDLVPTQTECDGATGTIAASASGGTFPYAYALDGGPPQLSNVFGGLPLGTYSVQVTDDNGCTATNTTTITEPERPEVAFETGNAPCEGDGGGTLDVLDASMGTAPFNYTIGAQSNTDGSFSNLPNGFSTMVVTDANNCTTEYPVSIVPACLNPNEALTPNGDGFNDTWTIVGSNLFPRIEVFVYNRWGQRVFHDQGYLDEWDGKSAGVTLPTATYYYIIYYDADEGKSGGFLKGSVTIIR